MVRPDVVDSASVVVSHFAASFLRLAAVSSETVRRADWQGCPDPAIGHDNLSMEAHDRRLELDWRSRHPYTLGELTIGDNTVISQHSYLCTGSHDYTRPTFDLYAVPIHIGAEAWLATNVFVGPGVTVGRGSILGACSVANKDVPAGMICRGNPLEVLRPRDVDNA